MKRKELMQKGLAILLSSTIIMAGCASNNNNTIPIQQSENPVSETDIDSQNPNDKATEENEKTPDDNKNPENEAKLQENEDEPKKNDSDISESTEKEDETAVLTDIDNGPIYETIQSIDSDLQIQDADSGAYLIITMEKTDEGVDSLETIRRFFWDAVQFLKTEIFKDSYDSVRFTFLGKDSFESFNVGKFEGFDDYATTYIGPLSPIEKNYFPAFYELIFPTRDVSIATEKSMYDLSKKYGTEGYELPDNYQEGYLWLFSHFDYGCGFSFDEKAITVTIPVLNTEKYGEETGATVFSALEEFYTLSYSRPETFPYDSLTILCTDPTNTTVWTYVTDKSTGDWDIAENTASGNFLTGLKRNSDSQTSGDNSQQQPQDNDPQQQTSESYVLNTSTMKIHKPSCSAAKKIAPENYSTSNSSISDLESQGYSRCGICLE